MTAAFKVSERFILGGGGGLGFGSMSLDGLSAGSDFSFEYRIRKAAGQTSQTGDFRFRF